MIFVILHGLKIFLLSLFSVVGLELDELDLDILSSIEDLTTFEQQFYPW